MKKRHTAFQHSVAGNKAVGISRNIKDAHPRLFWQQFLRENSAIYARHDDVSQQKVDSSRMPGFHLHGFFSILGNEHLVSMGFEERPRQFSKWFGILDEQNCF